MANENRNRGIRAERRVDPDRYAWVSLYKNDVVILVNDHDEDQPDSDLQDVVLVTYTRSSGKGVAINLSQLTREELDRWKEIVDLAYEEVGPIVDELDRRAAQAWEEGDDSYPRSYRAVPRFNRRERRKPQYGQGIRSGSPGSSGGSGADDHDGGVRAQGGNVPDGDPHEG